MSILYMKIIKNLEEQSVSGHKTLLPFLMTFSFKMNCLLMLHDETKNPTKTEHKVGALQLTAPKMVPLLGAGARGHDLLPLSNPEAHTARPQQAPPGCSAARVFAQGGSSPAFDFGLHLLCPWSSSWPSSGQLPSTTRPGRGMPAGAARAGPPRSLLLWKTSHVQSKFILGYSTAATIRHDRAERSLRRGEREREREREHRCPGRAGPAGHGAGRRPERPWRSRAERGGQSPGRAHSGRGRRCPRRPRGPARTRPLPGRQTKLRSLRTAAPGSCHRRYSGCGATTERRRGGWATAGINNKPSPHPGGSACAGPAEGLGSCSTARGEGGRSSSPQHLLTPRLPERPEASGACPPPRPGPHTLPEPEPGPAAATGAASARAAGGEAAGSLPVVYK